LLPPEYILRATVLRDQIRQTSVLTLNKISNSVFAQKSALLLHLVFERVKGEYFLPPEHRAVKASKRSGGQCLLKLRTFSKRKMITLSLLK
jgi:hypothetical protein